MIGNEVPVPVRVYPKEAGFFVQLDSIRLLFAGKGGVPPPADIKLCIHKWSVGIEAVWVVEKHSPAYIVGRFIHVLSVPGGAHYLCFRRKRDVRIDFRSGRRFIRRVLPGRSRFFRLLT